MIVAIVANGEISDYDYLRTTIKNFDLIIAVDNGLLHLDKINVSPSVIIGDLDSCSKELLERYAAIKTLAYPEDKDQTDLEIALEYCFSLGVKKAVIFAATGNRTDHLLGNIFAISRYKDRVIMDSETEEISFINKSKIIKTTIGQTLSLVPICGPCKNIVTKGLKWELDSRDLDQSFIGISNVALKNEISVSLESGLLLYVLQKNL